MGYEASRHSANTARHPVRLLRTRFGSARNGYPGFGAKRTLLATTKWYSPRVRAVFFGTPAIAVPALHALTQTAKVVGVVSQPDRPSGRGLAVTAPEVKRAALELGLPVYQPQKVRSGELEQWLRDKAADVAVVLAYGRILPGEVLAIPTRGFLNLHASLLPKYRGAAPINWAIVSGEAETGISLMQMDAGLDTGAVFARRAIAIAPDETAGQLAERIAELSRCVVIEDVPRAVSGELEAVPQDESRASHAPLIRREHLEIDWNQQAEAIVNLIRGMAPRPGAFTTVHGKKLKLFQARRVERAPRAAAGTVEVEDSRALVATGGGALEVLSAQAEGRTVQAARDLINGRVLRSGDVLGTS